MARNPNRELARKAIDRQMKTGATAQEIVDKIDPLLRDPRMDDLAQELADAKAEIARLTGLLEEVSRISATA